jgi:hypothetical protein
VESKIIYLEVIMIATIGALLLLAGVSVFFIGFARYLFPSTKNLMPEGFKKIMTMPYGVAFFLLGLVLLRFFSN